MLTRLVEFTLRYRFLVLALAALMCVVGVIALWQLPFDAFPDTTPVLVQVNVSAPGWAADDLERLVTYPVEQAVTGLSGLVEVRSVTNYSLCQVTAIFDDNTDLYLARQQVSEKLPSIELPDGVGRPELGPVSTGLGEIFHYIVTGETEEPSDPRTAQDWILKPQLLSLPGVAEVNSWGGFEKQYLIMFDPDQLARYSLSLGDVVETIRVDLGNVPGGQIVRGGEMTVVRGIGVVESIEQIRRIVIAAPKGAPLTVDDIAEVVISHQIRRGATTYNGRGEAVLGLGFMITGQNPPRSPIGWRCAWMRRRGTCRRAFTPCRVRTNRVGGEDTPHGRAQPVVRRLLVVAVFFMFLGNMRGGLSWPRRFRCR
jgi:cobalt-zinc-cadmium resistance protein CzcA